jgi:hypothetical protein
MLVSSCHKSFQIHPASQHRRVRLTFAGRRKSAAQTVFARAASPASIGASAGDGQRNWSYGITRILIWQWLELSIAEVAQATPMGHEYCGLAEEVGKEVRNIKPASSWSARSQRLTTPIQLLRGSSASQQQMHNNPL